MLLREIEQLTDNLLHPPQTVFHRHQVFALSVRRKAAFANVIQAVQNAAEGIIDLMRDACRQLPHRRELLGIQHLLFQPFLLGHIARDPQHSHNRALIIAQRRHADHGGPCLAGAGQQLHLIDLLGPDIQR